MEGIDEEPGVVELVKPFIGLSWSEHIFSGDCGIAIKCVIVDIKVSDNVELSKLIIVLDGKLDREVDLTGIVSTAVQYKFGIGFLDAFTGKTVNFLVVDVNENADEAWLAQGTIGDAVMDKIKDATVGFLGPEVGGFIAGLWDFFWGMFVGPAALIENAGTLYNQATAFAGELQTDPAGKFLGLFQSFWDALVAQADAANPPEYLNDPTCGDNPWDLNCNHEKFNFWYWTGNAIGIILTIMTGSSVTHALKSANLGGKIAGALAQFHGSMARAVEFASNVYRYLGRFTVRTALAAAAFLLSYELAELFGGFFDSLFASGFGAAAGLMMARWNMDFFGFSPGDLFDSSAQAAFRGGMRVRALLGPEEVGRLGAYTDSVQRATLRSVDLRLLDVDPANPLRGLKPGVLERWAKYLDGYQEGGGNLDQLLNDINAYRNKVGSSRAFGNLQSLLASSAPQALRNVDFMMSEWRAVVRGSGHNFNDITHVSQHFDVNGNPVDPIGFAEIDAKLAINDIVEVKSTTYWSGKGGLKEYLAGKTTQLGRQRQLLQTWGGSEIRVYIDPSLMSKAQAFLTSEGILGVKLFVIPGA